mmetsp:Transcript_29779/g.58072  ORF Transcript_29779/g.58072 Transcript_29779/m.58072 type:complete len:266 (+) Transcript_29779:1866-2663(+)
MRTRRPWLSASTQAKCPGSTAGPVLVSGTLSWKPLSDVHLLLLLDVLSLIIFVIASFCKPLTYHRTSRTTASTPCITTASFPAGVPGPAAAPGGITPAGVNPGGQRPRRIGSVEGPSGRGRTDLVSSTPSRKIWISVPLHATARWTHRLSCSCFLVVTPCADPEASQCTVTALSFAPSMIDSSVCERSCLLRRNWYFPTTDRPVPTWYPRWSSPRGFWPFLAGALVRKTHMETVNSFPKYPGLRKPACVAGCSSSPGLVGGTRDA